MTSTKPPATFTAMVSNYQRRESMWKMQDKNMLLIKQGKGVPAHSVSATPPKDNTKTSSLTGRPQVSYHAGDFSL